MQAQSISGGTRPADPIITEQLLPSVEEQDNTCEICYDNTKDTVLCWNSHLACMVCYEAMWNMRERKCGFCREKLFDWHEGQDPWPAVAPPRSVQGGGRHDLNLGDYYRSYIRGNISAGVFAQIIAAYSITGRTDTETSFPDITAEQAEQLGWGVGGNQIRIARGSELWGVLNVHNCNPETNPERFAQFRADWWRRRLTINRDGAGVQAWSYVRVPLLHEETRFWPFGEICSEATGRIIGLTDDMHAHHPDYNWLRSYSFSEEQLFYSPNFERQIAPAGQGTSRYKYIGRKGPLTGGQRIPFPQKEHDNDSFRGRCGHCKKIGHTANWWQNPRRSSCPEGNEKDEYRKQRVDRTTIATM